MIWHNVGQSAGLNKLSGETSTHIIIYIFKYQQVHYQQVPKILEYKYSYFSHFMS